MDVIEYNEIDKMKLKICKDFEKALHSFNRGIDYDYLPILNAINFIETYCRMDGSRFFYEKYMSL